MPSRAAAAEVEDLTYDPLDIDSILEDVGAGPQQQQQAGTAAAAAACGGAGDADDGGKLALKFKTQGCEDVTVFVRPGEPLAAALDKFRAYAAKQGWGTVQKFVSPDGDRLTGEETAADLDLENDDIIEYHLQK
jgi:hypothetical protein